MTRTPIEAALKLPDGRRLAYREIGAPTGRPLLFFHGGADSRLAADLIDAAAHKAGVRVIAPDRPGFGGSDFLPERTIGSWSHDVSALAAHLKLDQFEVLGHSGGGPHALAVAAGSPDRITRVLLVAGGAPREASPSGMAPPFRINRWLAIRLPLFQRAFLRSHRGGLTNPEKFLRQWGRLSRADGAMFESRKDMAQIIVAEMLEGYRQGIDGAALEGRLYYQPWGFELTQLQTPVDLYYGDADPMAPSGWGQYFADKLPNGRLHALKGEGHFSGLVNCIDQMLAPRES